MRYIKFYRHLIPYWRKEVLILLLNMISFPLSLITPYLTKLIVDKAYINKDFKLFIFLAILGGIIFLINGIITALVNYLNRFIRLRINFDLNRKVFKKLQYFSYSFFQNTSTGQNLYKITYDIERVTQLISDIMPQVIFFIPKALFIFAIVFYLNRNMALFSLALLPFLYILLYFFTTKLKKVIKAWIENSQRIFEKAQEILSHIQLIKAFGKERREEKFYLVNVINNFRLNLANVKLELTGSFTIGAINRIILGLIVFYGGYQVIKERMTLGTLSAIALYLNQLSSLQSALVYFLQQISLGFVSCERLEIILDAPAELQDKVKIKDAMFSKGAIEFRKLTFGYNPDRLILDNLSFCIEGGLWVGLVGKSGCGKTTLINLLLRLYKPLGGEIFIDGYNIDAIQSSSFYDQIGVALQEPWLWNDTIENNIRYGKEEVDFKEIQETARITGIDDFINNLQDGYQTIIGENACKISEGQKQRLAIARAVIKKPKILILDEALSSVDAELEGVIIDNIRNSLKNSTIITISHRLSTISRMDEVYFWVSSNRIEIGTHAELLQRNSQYKDYLAGQLLK